MDLQPVDFMSALGPLPDPLKAMQDEQATKLALQGASLHNEAQGQALAEHQRSVQRQAGFGAAFRDYLTHPTTTGLISLFGDYPEFHDQLKEAHSALDEDQQRVNTTQLGSVAALAAKGDYKGAAAILQRRIDADRAAGQDTSDDQEILDHLNDPDPAKQKGAMALTTIALAGAVGPDKAAAFLKANGLSNEPFTLSQGQVRYGPDGKPIASVAPKQEYLVIPEGGKAVPVGPGGPQAAGTIDGNPSPAPAGAPASGSPHRVQGWTPRARDGGDNPDHVVDAKVARLASVVGVDPDTPLTPQQLGALATALPATEGGPGSLAARNNNPGNIKDGPFARRQAGYAGAGEGGYARFETPQAGQQATTSLLNRFYGRGQTTIRDIIEGKPVGGPVRGATAPQAASGGARPGDPPGTLYGNPRPGYHLLTPDEAQAQGLDTAKRWQRGPDGQTTAVGDASVSPPGDPNKTGQEYLATVPAGMASQIKALAEGRLPLPSSFALGKPYWQRLLQATAQYDPTFDAGKAKERQAAMLAFTGNGKAAQLVGSVNRVANHLQTLYDASEKLVGPDTGFGPLNSVLAYGGQRFQPQSLKAYNSALPLVAGELEKIARGSTGTLHGVEQIMSNLSPSESLSTRRQAIKTAIELIHGAIEPLQNQYNSAFTGSSARPAIPWVTPRSQSIYDRLSGEDFSLGSGDAAPHAAPGGASSPPPGAKLIGKRSDDGRPVYQLPDGRKVSPR
jgi:hypothetical protein